MQELTNINWNNLRIENEQLICGEDCLLCNLEADTLTQGIHSGFNKVPSNIRRTLMSILEEYFNNK